MFNDPYITAWWRQQRNRVRHEGIVGGLRALGIPLVAGLLLVPLVRPTFLAFLDREESTWGEGMVQIVLRASIVVIGWLSLDVYGALVRGPSRDVLALWPVDGGAVARAELVRVAASRWWMLPGAAVVLSPVATEGAPALWAVALIALTGCFALGLTASALGHLYAIQVAESPRWAPYLDLLRGTNPRPQAAFLYAPGAVLLVTGGLLMAASSAVPRVVAGDPMAIAALAAPWVVAVLAWLPVPSLSRRTYFRGSIVLSEIDARYATLVDTQDAVRVYLDWAPRFLPSSWQPYALNDLRHGWRTRRTLVTGAWLLGLLALAAGWTEAESGPIRAAGVAIGAVFLVAANGVWMSFDEPAFLRAWLPPGGLPAAGARAVVLAMWAAPIVGLATASALIRHGFDAAGFVFVASAAGVLVAAALAIGCGPLRERAMAVYAPVASVVAAALVAGISGMST